MRQHPDASSLGSSPPPSWGRVPLALARGAGEGEREASSSRSLPPSPGIRLTPKATLSREGRGLSRLGSWYELAHPLHRHVPAAGRRRDHFLPDPRHDGGASQEHPERLARRDAAHLRRLAADLVEFRPVRSGLPVRRARRLARLHDLFDGRRRHLDAVRHPHHLPDAHLHPGELEVGPAPAEGIHGLLPGARDHDDRRLHVARPHPLLRLLRSRPHPDVPDHRRVGRPAPRLRRLQVLPLHAARLGADAARHDGHGLRGRHDRDPGAARASLPAGDADLVVARLPRLLRGEAAHVAGAYLAARTRTSRRRPPGRWCWRRSC